MEIDTHELAWAAGFYDGEGSTALYRNKNTKSETCFLKVMISQVNRGNLERFKAAVGGVGNIYGPYKRKNNPNKKPNYAFDSGRFEIGQAIIAMLWQWLGPEKRAQASKALTGGVFRGCYQSEENKRVLAERNKEAWSDPAKRAERLQRLADMRVKAQAVMKGRAATQSQREALDRGRRNRWAVYRATKPVTP